MNVTTNRDDIITIGSYSKDLTSYEYVEHTISIPIESIKNQTGQTIVTFTLNDEENSITRTVYLNVLD